MKLEKKKSLLQKRRWRIRKKVSGTADRPRLAVHFSNKHIYAQCIDDVKGHRRRPFREAARSAALPRTRREAPPRPTAREAPRADVVKITSDQKHDAESTGRENQKLTGFVCAKHGRTFQKVSLKTLPLCPKPCH